MQGKLEKRVKDVAEAAAKRRAKRLTLPGPDALLSITSPACEDENRRPQLALAQDITLADAVVYRPSQRRDDRSKTPAHSNAIPRDKYEAIQHKCIELQKELDGRDAVLIHEGRTISRLKSEVALTNVDLEVNVLLG
jgi:hypothetical protein